MKKAILLLSGGLDSATVASMAQAENFELIAVSFNYAQKHSLEINNAKNIVKKLKIKKHIIININPEIFGNSALTDDKVAVPQNSLKDDIPITYVPARNTIFLSYALAIAESNNAYDIFIGANAVDYSGYPDCRPEYIKAFEQMANLATKAALSYRINIHAPLMNMDKAAIIKKGISLGVDYSLTHSCYSPIGKKACGKCDSCLLRLKGFAEAKLTDPVEYI
jgi:7-cyano-7-deazaguanine synthase